ncbi:MAG TPA: hypothetical protein VKF63_08570 [Terracidiphilus sp.]|nr:hypothetical protein [Terracidiphilus sp.]
MRDANIEDPEGKNIKEEEQLSASTYKIIEPSPEDLNDKIAAAGLYIYPDVNAEAKVQKPASEPPTSQPPSRKSLTERKQRFAENPIRFYAMIGVGLGILIGVIFAAVSLFMGSPVGRYDLGPVIADGTGLKGHLYINWEKTLHYRLTLETIYPEQQAGFALEVANPPYPLFIEIHLQDDQGLILCSRGIVLKYDAQSTATTAANHPNEPPAAIDIAQLNAQEQEREQGKDIFQNQIAPGGQVVALNAQGEIPCSAKSYEKTTQWNFSTNFPSLAEQDEGLERLQEMRGIAGQRSAAHKKAVKAAEKLLPFSIEGDDMIVEFDVNRGVIVTNGRNTFFFDKTSMGSADPVWQEYPVSIHFRCDRNSDCTLMHAGAGALRARMKR